MRFVKWISKNIIIATQGGGNPDNPLHLQTMIDDASAGEGIDPSDLQAGYMDETLLLDLIKTQDENNRSYKDKRRRDYPSMAERMETLWEGGQSQIDMKAIIDGVNAAHPKT